MNIRFSALQDAVLSDIKTITSALKLLFMLGATIAVLFLIFVWDSRCDNPFSEVGPTELIQTLLLSLCTLFLFREAVRCPDMRNALILAGGLTGCMLIREQDYFLDMISHGFWKWPALILAFGCLTCAAVRLRETISSLAVFIRWRHFPLFLTGIVIVLTYSRLFGMSVLWKTLLPGGEWRAAKNAIEESSELLGYALMLTSVLLLRFRKK
ncbi:hypothetical protein [uncultured Mailhella sp.]|uniref:hypothetical protein n=1 Tax=uncultured Mailhella sp. TaxID=1981031 RepID=UPI0025E1BDCB|nr:hypothetical protein [uncultured Mailhella sp.]